MSDPASPPPATTGKRLRKVLLTFFKIAIAIVGIWYVCYKVHLDDTGELPAGSEINAVTFPEKVEVHILALLPPLPGKTSPMVRIEFPTEPIPVMIDGKAYTLVIDEATPVPGQGTLGLSHQKPIPLDYLALVKGQRIQQGLKSLLAQARAKWYLVFFAWILLGIPFWVTAIRWRGLMRPQGIDMPLGKCLQLTFVGQFYSIILPGITGGDLVKIVYASRLTGSKTKSFITIILDRVIGLVALMVIAGTAAGVQLLLNSRHGAGPAGNQSTLLNVLLLIVILLGIMVVGCTFYFSHRLRKLIGIEWFIDNFSRAGREDTGPTAQHAHLEHLFRVLNGLVLTGAILGIAALAILRWVAHSGWAMKNTPIVYIGIGILAAAALAAAAGLALHRMLVDKATPVMGKLVQTIIGVDETLHVYRGHFGLLVWAFFISLISQLTLPLSAWLSGMAFGMDAPVTHYLAYVPLAILAASLPISPPQGAGFLEFVLNQFFVNKGEATASQAFTLTQSVRFLPIIWNLFGAYWVVTGKYSRKSEPET
jgi:uncharacterized membrane protein YbhN (UPF0104 family)